MKIGFVSFDLSSFKKRCMKFRMFSNFSRIIVRIKFVVQRTSKNFSLHGHALSSRLKIKSGRSSAKDGVPERLRCGAIQKEVS